MSNSLIPFTFESNEIRVTTDEQGEPLFVAKDVAVALGYVWNGSARIEHVPDEWKGVTSVVTPSGTQQMSVLTEQGLYFFVSRSDKPKALPFQKWAAGEVMPSIRKTGRYEHPQAASVASNAAPHALPYAIAIELTPAAVRAAEAFGFKGNQALLSANRALTHFTGANLLEAMGQAQLVAPDNDPLITPTDIEVRLKLKYREGNKMLTKYGFQTAHRDHKNKIYYELTEKGATYGVAIDTDKGQKRGAPIRQIKWRSSIVPVLSDLIIDDLVA